MQAQERYLPDLNRVSVLTAVVLLTYAIDHLVKAPGITLTLRLPGFYLAYPMSLSTAMTIMAAGLTASGMEWLLRSHPSLRYIQSPRTVDHWLLPTLTAFILGVLLNILPTGSAWWIGFALSSGILVAVFMADYITVEPGAPNYPIASAGLIALSYALFYLFVIALRTAGARLFVIIPAIFLAAGLVSLRTLHLRQSGRWDFPWAIGIGIICVQITGGMHYWPLSAVQFGLILIGPLYALTTFTYSLGEDVPLRTALVEPGIILALTWITAIFLR
jgi:hypothetical protein